MTTAYARRLLRIGGGAVVLTRTGSLATIELAHKEKKNALSGKMMAELEVAVATLEHAPDVAVVLLRGQGDFFCSGADLSMVVGEMSSPQEGRDMCAFMQEVTTRFSRLPCISVAVVAGGAMGGGTELSTACDHRIFVKGSKWQCVHPRMGLTTGWGGGARLARLVGRSKAIQLLCGSEALDAETALAWGVCDLVVAPEEVESRTSQFVARYLAAPIESVRACKSVVTAGCDYELDKALKLELGLFSGLWGAPANAKAVASVLQRISHHDHATNGISGGGRKA